MGTSRTRFVPIKLDQHSRSSLTPPRRYRPDWTPETYIHPDIR